MGPFQQKRTPTAAHVRTSKFVAVTSMSIFEAEKNLILPSIQPQITDRTGVQFKKKPCWTTGITRPSQQASSLSHEEPR
jgi:hypothetical protein